MTALDLILPRLERVKRSGKGYTARCPAHEDKTASLSVCEGDDGRALIHCFAGCSVHDVTAAIGLTVSDLFPERRTPATAEERERLRLAARESMRSAALNVLDREALTVAVAARAMADQRTLTPDDLRRVALAESRIKHAAEVLRDR